MKISPVAGQNGCEVSSVPVGIHVYDNPVVTIAAGNAAICAGSTAEIKTTGIVLDAGVRNESYFTYQWAVNGIVLLNATQSTYSQVLTTPGKYEFVMRMVQNNSLGCASDWSVPVTVTVEEIPQISLMVNNDTYCSGSSALLTATVVPDGNY